VSRSTQGVRQLWGHHVRRSDADNRRINGFPRQVDSPAPLKDPLPTAGLFSSVVREEGGRHRVVHAGHLVSTSPRPGYAARSSADGWPDGKKESLAQRGSRRAQRTSNPDRARPVSHLITT
jgi:hypothetical protein